jgi:hypothetical protein
MFTAYVNQSHRENSEFTTCHRYCQSLLMLFYYGITSPSQLTLCVIEVIPAKRTTRTIRTLEPPEKTRPVKVIPTSSAPFIRRLHVRPNNAVTNGTFALPFQCSLHIPPKRDETFNDTACAENDNLKGAKPGLPILLRDADASAGRDGGRV